MSTRIHQKIPLPSPFRYLGEHLTHMAPGSEMHIRSIHGTMIYFLSGEASLSINKGEPVPVREGDVAIVPGPSTRVYSSSAAGTLHYYTVGLLTPLPRSQSGAPAQQKELVALIKKAFGKCTVLSGHGVALRQRLLTLRHDLDDQGPGSSVLVYSAVLNLCIETVRLAIDRQRWQVSAPGRRKSRSLINGALEYMLRNLRHNPSIENIARALKVSAEHLCRSFRSELGTTPRMALRDLQLDEAKALLINSPLEIHRIAERSGFSSATTFCRLFRKVVGVTPTEYRAANRGNFKSTQSTRWREDEIRWTH